MVRLIFPLFLVLLYSGCSSLEEKDDTLGWDAHTLFTQANDKLKAGNYTKAIYYYDRLAARYPYGDFTQQAQLNKAYAHYRANEPAAALATTNDFIRFNPRHAAVAYAHYLKGLIHFTPDIGLLDRIMPTDSAQRDPGSTLEAYHDFAKVVQDFPNSRYAKDARQRMLFLRNNLARNEIHIARYYLKRGAFLAAANRANYVVQHYARTPSVKPALEIMQQAYTQLGLEQLAADARKVLAFNQNNGSLIESSTLPADPSWLQSAWEYLELDKN